MFHLKSVILLTASLLLVGVGGAMAETQFICSITESLECSAGVDCGPPEFDGVTPPTFFHLDIGKKVITLLAPAERRGEKSDIDAVLEQDDGWVVAGLENGRAWNVYVTHDGHMTLTVTMDGTTWIAFGNAMPAAHAAP